MTQDLSTIKRKLDTAQYQEPWEYVDEVWPVLKKANNNQTSSEVFEAEIDAIMQGLGYCCGRKVRKLG